MVGPDPDGQGRSPVRPQRLVGQQADGSEILADWLPRDDPNMTYLPIVTVEGTGILCGYGPVQVEAFRELIRLEQSEVRPFTSVIAESRGIDLQRVEYVPLREGLPS